MRFALLGRLDVFAGDKHLVMDAPRQLVLLGRLLMTPNLVVGADELIDVVWGDRPPRHAANGLQALVSRMRRVLGSDRLAGRSGGYLLVVHPGERDVDEFELHCRAGEAALDAGDPAAASQSFNAALRLWRGRPFGEHADAPFARAEVARLEELHLSVTEGRIEAELALGHHAAVVGDLEGLARTHPLRERLRGQLMVALYRSGRQAEALDVYKETRLQLVEELGIEPNPELQRLVQAILLQDSSLTLAPSRPGGGGAAAIPSAPAAPEPAEPPAPPAPLPRSPRSARSGRRRGPVAAAVGLVVAAAVIGALVFAPDGGSLPPPATSMRDGVAVIDPHSEHFDGFIPTGRQPGPIASSADTIWVANLGDGTLSKIRSESRRVQQVYPIGADLADVTADHSGAWVTTVGGRLTHIDARYGVASRLAKLARINPKAPDDRPAAAGHNSLWIVDPAGLLERVDPTTGVIRDRIEVGTDPSDVAVGSTGVWVVNSADGTVSHVDDSGGVVATIPVGHDPRAVVTTPDAVWVAVRGDDTVLRINPKTDVVSRVISVHGHPSALAASGNAVWSANSTAGNVTRIDARSGKPVSTIAVGGSPSSLVVADDRVWVSIDAPPTVPQRQRGTLTVETPGDVETLDPAQSNDSLSRQIIYATCTNLLNYPDEPGRAGTVLQPEAAESLPTVSRGGRRYTFVVRPRFRFAPPSNEPVTAATFVHVLERVADPRMHSPNQPLLHDVVGVPAFETHRARHIAGVRADGDVLTIDLMAPAPDFLARISLPTFCAVPRDTPVSPRGIAPLPGSGPYTVADYQPHQDLVLVPNTNYHGDRPQGSRRIVVRLGVAAAASISDLEDGRADYVTDAADSGVFADLADSADLEGQGAPAVLTNPLPGIRYVVLNTAHGVFRDRSWRLAASYAVNRTALNAAYDVGLPRGTGGRP
ncbi:MAG: hypothetical protein QOJ03_2174, partial [Frankiaceae bacterium]|nr:hypothetical protein [Frankiaceae bacterium]